MSKFTAADFSQVIKHPNLLGKFKGWTPTQLAGVANAAKDDWALIYLAYQVSALFNRAWANHIGQGAVNSKLALTQSGANWMDGHPSIPAIIAYLGKPDPKTFTYKPK